MVDNITFAPLGPVWTGAIRTIEGAGVQEKVIQLLRPQLRQRLLSKGLDAFQIREIKRQDRNQVVPLVEGKIPIRGLGPDGVPGTQNELVWLGLQKQFFDSFESLVPLIRWAIEIQHGPCRKAH